MDLDALAGKTIGGCALEKEIGKGAMGVVYRAKQKCVGRDVAFKILDPKFSGNEEYVERFKTEAKAAAGLNHPNIVQVFDFGSENGLYYIVNEYVDGGTLQNLIKQKGVLQPEETIDYAIQAAKGLVAAAEAGIIHRDIKPDNLMLTKDGTVKIADFGLALTMKPEDVTAGDDRKIMGTPFYMSPEQAKCLPMDARSDIYSLGVTMYCMVMGEVPFDADSVVGILLKQISSDRPDPCAINPSLPSLVGSMIMRMMDKDPANRPQSAQELLTELETAKQILQPAAPPPSLAEISEVPPDRRGDFKPLPANCISRLIRVEASADVLTRIITSISDDSGVTIDMENPFPLNTVVEVRFTDPSKGEGELSGLGLVRWNEAKQMGVTLVKIQAIPKGGGAVRLSGPMAIAALTATPVHQRLLRLVYANAGQFMNLPKIASSLGVGAKMAADPIKTFERASLIKTHEGGKYELLWPKDEALQREIVVWIERHGLK